MKLPLSWLNEFVDLDLPADELAALMGLRGLEVEEITTPGAGTSGVRTAKVLHREPHPNADKLQFVRVTGENGEGEVEVVCGAHNFEVGDVVAHAPPGATLPGGFTLEARKLRGVVSNGMLCSATELEMGSESDGIAILPPDTPLGVDVTTLVPLGEPVIEVAVMADRGDHHSILGVARDLAAILDRPLRTPTIAPLPEAGGIPIAIEATDGCSHFVGVTLTGATDGTAPWWMTFRLHQCGVRSISTIVDVTNYVMLERGQPLHAFDQARLHGPEIRVRWADDGEELTTLDDKVRSLHGPADGRIGDLVVADADRGVALAGVMGGLETEVTGDTDTILLEAAVWKPEAIRDTSSRLHLTSEASNRFARRVDPAGARAAAARATELLTTLTGATATGVTEAGAPTTDQPSVTYDAARGAAFLGLDDLDADAQAALLARSGSATSVDGDVVTVTPPTWRGDLARPADVAEEVARLHGYDRIPAEMPPIRTRGGRSPRQTALREVARAARAAGFHEAVLRPFVGDDALVIGARSPEPVALANPLAQDAHAMRQGLAEGLLGAVRRNVGQGRPGVALFEIGRVFHAAGGPLDETLAAFDPDFAWTHPDGGVLPTQPRVLGLAAQGRRVGAAWVDDDGTVEIWDLLAVLEDVVAVTSPADAPRTLERRATRVEGLHPGRTAELLVDGTVVGVVGQLHPAQADERDLPEPVFVAELVLDPLLAHLGADEVPRQAVPIHTHPAMVFDVAVLAPDAVSYATVEAAVRGAVGELLDEAWQFDEYRSDALGDGMRSIGIRVRLQDPDRQLTDEDEAAAIERVAAGVEGIGASLRR